MNHATAICPQCGAPLPRQALWRTVICIYCSAEVTPAEDVVRAAWFKEAYQRSIAPNVGGAAAIACNGERYQVLLPLGRGATARLMLAQRLGVSREQVVIKLASPDAAPGRLRREADVLRQLQALSGASAAYFSQRLPQLAGYGEAEDGGGTRSEALLLRSPTGYWGSLADVRRHYPDGIAPSHAVWMWRRILEVLGYIHATGWSHGRLSPDHLLVQPADHGILLIGWADARHGQSGATDLMQSAWSIRSLLHGGDGEPPLDALVPAPLAALLKRASEDARWCAKVGATGIDQALQAAARTVFGPPRFIDFSPDNQR